MLDLRNIDSCYIDFDGTAFNTIKAVCELYDKDFSSHPDYKYIDWKKVQTWNFEELSLATKEQTSAYFEDKRFFNIVEPMPGFNDVLYYLQRDFRTKFCTLGSTQNLIHKSVFIHYHYPHIGRVLLNLDRHSDKSQANLQYGILIDDRADNLESSNANIKILFGRDYPWNKGWTGLRCQTWLDLGMLFGYYDGKEFYS